MSKLLTQEEIDALLSQETGEEKGPLGGGDKQKDLRLYDFRRPERVSKDQIKTLRNIHEIFARLLAPYLSSTLRTMVDVKSPVIDQVTYLEFTMSASDYTNMYIFSIDKLDGQALLDIDPELTFFIVDRLFGGTGLHIAKRTDIQDLTEIERSVMRNIAEKILDNFREAWQQIDELQPKIDTFETNPQLVTIAPSSETMIVLNFPVTVRNYEFTILLCFPYFMMEPLLKKLLSQNYMALLKKKTTEEDYESLKRTIEQTSIEMVIDLGTTEITIEDFLDLEPGNIIALDQRITTPIIAKVSSHPKFAGEIKTRRNKYVFQVRNFIDSEGEVIHE